MTCLSLCLRIGHCRLFCEWCAHNIDFRYVVPISDIPALSTSEMLPGVLPSYANHCEDYGMVPTSTSLPLPTSFTNTNLLSASQSLLRSVDNDSSATMSADESPASTTVASLLTTSFSAGNESVFGLTAESGPSAAYYTRCAWR